MRLQRIRINGLFHQYNFSCDLTRKCNILIGPNGIGKSTILRIIAATARLDLITVSKYVFESIDVTFMETKNHLGTEFNFSFTRKDLVPTIQQLLPDSFTLKEDPKDYRLFRNFLHVMFDYDGFADRYCDYVYSKLLDVELNKAVTKLKNDSDNVVIERLDSMISLYKQNTAKTKTVRIFKNTNVYKNLSSLVANLFLEKLEDVEIDTKTPLIDLVSGIEFKSSNEPVFSSELVAWLQMPKSFKKITNNDPDDDDYEPYRLVAPSNLEGQLQEGMVRHFWAIAYQSINDFSSKVVEASDDEDTVMGRNLYYLRQLIEHREFDIDGLITNNYYFHDTAEELNRIMANFHADVVTGREGYNRKFKKMFSDILLYCSIAKIDINADAYTKYSRSHLDKLVVEFFHHPIVEGNITEYIIPTLVSDFPISFTTLYEIIGHSTRITLTDKQREYCGLCFLFYRQYIQHWRTPNYELMSTRMSRFLDLLEKYMPNRRIEITPRGLKVTPKDAVSVPTYGITPADMSDFAGLNTLSSGEKKILLLLALSCFYDDMTILVDEPELSLSIVWQRSIINDMCNGQLSNLTVATHSPYLTDNEDAAQYMIFLPEVEDDDK